MPQQLFAELFVRMREAQLFPDGRTFAQVRAVARVLAARLLAPGGLLTTPVESGQQRDAGP